MSVLREPEDRAIGALRQRPGVHEKPETVADLVSRAAAALHDGRDTEAESLLLGVLGNSELGRLPAATERVLTDIGADERGSAQLRAGAWTTYARSRQAQGRPEDARQALAKAYELAPEPPVLYHLATIAYRTDSPAAAGKLLDDALQRWPDDATLKVLAAAATAGSGRPERARALLAEVLRDDADDTTALALLARLELAEDRYEAAIEPARASVRGQPSLGRALLVVAMHGTGRLQEDPGLLEAVLADPPDDTWVLVRLAHVLLDVDRPADARTVLDRACALDPEDAEIRRTRGWTNAVLRDYDAAAADLDQAARFGDDPWLVSLRGEVARLRGDPAGAVELFEQLGDSEPDWVASSLGSALTVLGRYDDARTAYERALRRDPDDVPALCGLGELDFERGGPDGVARAETMLRHALDLQPDSALAHALLAEVMRRTGRLTEAVAGFDRSLELSPRYSYALASKGQTMIALGDRPGGLALLAEAAKESPQTTWILDELERELDSEPYEDADVLLRGVQREVDARGGDGLPVLVRRARLARRHRRRAEADRFYRKARKASDDPDLAREHAEVLSELGRFEEALAILDRLPRDADTAWSRIDVLWQLDRLPEVRSELEQMVAGGDPLPLAWAALGELHRMEGRRDEARRLLTTAHDQDPDQPYALASLGALEFDEGNLGAARSHLSRATELLQGYGFALSTLITLESQDGQAGHVLAILDRLRQVDPADRELARVRAIGYYGLGDYPTAREVLQACLVEAGDNATVLRARGWTELGLGQVRRASGSFAAAASLPDVPSALVETASTLTRVDLWRDALRSVRAAGEDNPFSDTAQAIVWLAAGDATAAVHSGLRGHDRVPRSEDAALYAVRALRRCERWDEATELARDTVQRWPRNREAKSELGRCLLGTGDRPGAQRMFEDVLAGLERQVHLDADEAIARADCLLLLDRGLDAAYAYLRALSLTDRTAQVLLDLVVASLLAGDVAQASVLTSRVREELDRLTAPTRRGTIAAGIHDLEVVRPPPPRAGAATPHKHAAARHGRWAKLERQVASEASLPEDG
jgi:tetratricopeptide (TPR) repeat protein